MNWHLITEKDKNLLGELVVLQNKTTPLFKTTVEVILEDIRILPKEYSVSHWIAYEDGRPQIAVVFGDCFWAHVAGKAYCNIVCENPNSIDQFRIGLDFCIAELKKSGVVILEQWTSPYTPALTELLESRVGSVVQKAPVSRLNLSEFEFEKWLPLVQKIEDQGIRLVTAKQLADEGVDWITALYPAMKEIREDIPSPDPISHPTLEEFGLHMTRNKLQDMYFAMLGDEIVGYSRLGPMPSDPEVLDTGLSGTVRAHRRKGIVTALKIKSLFGAKDLGRKWVQTDNEENNPMLKLNIALGFKEVDLSVCYHLEI